MFIVEHAPSMGPAVMLRRGEGGNRLATQAVEILQVLAIVIK